MNKTSKTSRYERGEAEMRFFVVVLIVCGLISGALWLLQWVRESKNAKVQARREAMFKKVEAAPKYPNGMYLVHCNRGLVDLVTNQFTCKIDKSSFVENDVNDWHLGVTYTE